MNNTTKEKYELAKKMLKGKIDVDEVVLMSGLPTEVVEQLKEEVNPSNPEIEMLKNLDTVDLNIGEILFDNLPAEDESEGLPQ
ncbi:MAG: hypothetical protein E7258_05525 [Lachnospiraceae bacterium]|nr:hypothetical protein [Lachnospiraceae bacterium]